METDIMSFKIVVDSCCELPEEYLEDPGLRSFHWDWKWETIESRMMRTSIRQSF